MALDDTSLVVERFITAARKPKGDWTPEERYAVAAVREAGETMTPEQRREQCISFAYGNLKIENPSVAPEDVARAYDRIFPN